MRDFSCYGLDAARLNRPYGITIDSNNMVYVSEDGNNRVSVFNLECHFVTSFGRKGAGPGEFDGPRGLVVDENGILYVCVIITMAVFRCFRVCIGYTLKVRWLSDLFNRVPKARGE